MSSSQVARYCINFCRKSDGVLLKPIIGRNLTSNSIAPLSISLSAARTFHITSVSRASGIKEFVPKWLRRDKPEPELTPEEYLGIIPKDAVVVARSPSQKFPPAYSPPENLDQQMEELCKEMFSVSSSESIASLEFPDDLTKFKFLDLCVESFRKRIPNSFVDDIRCVGDALDFFSKPVLPRDRILERIKESPDTPANVHAIPDYMTFEKEMELHENRDVFPNQDIIVSSLREKGKYKSVRKPKCPWEEAKGFELPVKYKRHPGY